MSTKMTSAIILEGSCNSGSWYANRDTKRVATATTARMVAKDCKRHIKA